MLEQEWETSQDYAGLGRVGQDRQGLVLWQSTTTFSLKLHLSSDLHRQVLALQFSSGNRADSSMFLSLNRELMGIFIADAGYTGEKLAREFHIEKKRWLLARPRKNMKKLMSEVDNLLYATRMIVEGNFRSLKMTYGLLTSLPRSVGGYLAHYLYALTAYVLA